MQLPRELILIDDPPLPWRYIFVLERYFEVLLKFIDILVRLTFLLVLPTTKNGSRSTTLAFFRIFRTDTDSASS